MNHINNIFRVWKIYTSAFIFLQFTFSLKTRLARKPFTAERNVLVRISQRCENFFWCAGKNCHNGRLSSKPCKICTSAVRRNHNIRTRKQFKKFQNISFTRKIKPFSVSYFINKFTFACAVRKNEITILS